MPRSAIDVLSVFDLDDPRPEPVAAVADNPPIEPLGYSIAEEIDRRVAEAVAVARAEEKADAEWHLTEALAEQASDLEARFEAERHAWVEEQSDRLSAAFDKCFEDIRDRLSAAAGRALRPILDQKLVERAIDELAASLEQMMTSQSAPVFSARGPQDLLVRLADKLGPRAAAIDFAADETADVCVVTGETVLETRIRDWASRLDHLEGQAQ